MAIKCLTSPMETKMSWDSDICRDSERRSISQIKLYTLRRGSSTTGNFRPTMPQNVGVCSSSRSADKLVVEHVVDGGIGVQIRCAGRAASAPEIDVSRDARGMTPYAATLLLLINFRDGFPLKVAFPEKKCARRAIAP